MNDVTELEGSLSFGGALGGSLDFGGSIDGTLDFDGVTVTCNDDYGALRNKPSIEGVVLEGDRLLTEFGETTLSNIEIKGIFDRVFGKD